jgi:hypothetical protein
MVSSSRFVSAAHFAFGLRTKRLIRVNVKRTGFLGAFGVFARRTAVSSEIEIKAGSLPILASGRIPARAAPPFGLGHAAGANSARGESDEDQANGDEPRNYRP